MEQAEFQLRSDDGSRPSGRRIVGGKNFECQESFVGLAGGAESGAEETAAGIAFVSDFGRVDKSDHWSWREEGEGGGDGFANEDRRFDGRFVPEDGADPPARPAMLDELRPGGDPKGVGVLGEEHYAAAGRDELVGERRLPVVVAVGQRQGPRVGAE